MIRFRSFSKNALLALVLVFAGSQIAAAQPAQGKRGAVPRQDQLKPTEEMEVFPYQLANYTQIGHETRIQNAPVIVVGEIESYEEIQDTEKSKNWSVWLRVETFLRTDRAGQETSDRIYLRTLPLQPPYQDMQPGDRCLMLLDRDLRFDNALVLPSEYHYYPVSQNGVVSKFWKDQPTRDDPTIREQSLSSFMEEIRDLVREISLAEQVKASDLVLTGTVTDSRQGEDQSADFYYVQVKPEKLFKGQPEGDTVTFIQRGNPFRWAIHALNRAAFKPGDRVLVFGNRDPTFSQPGPWNPKGQELWVFPYQKNSSLFLASRNAWRRGFRPIPLDELYADLESWSQGQN